MFQYAAGLALAEQRRTVLKLDVAWYRERSDHAAHNRYSLSCFNITEQFATEHESFQLREQHLRWRERQLVNGAAALLRMAGCANLAPCIADRAQRHISPTFGFYPEFFTLRDNTYLEGMFQSELFFAPIAPLVRLHFTFRYDPPAAIAAMLQKIRGAAPAVAVHLRYGDFRKSSPHFQGNECLPIDYYHRAAAIVLEHHPDATFFIFSDEIAAAKKEFRPAARHVYVDVTTAANPFDDLRLMAACDHALIANSTFSWWCGWLIENPEKIVIAPTPWFTSHAHYEGDIIPASWRKLERVSERVAEPARPPEACLTAS
jgi:hypothetical protein